MPWHDDILAAAAEYYEAKLAQHGATARGVDWNSEESQRQRHRQFLHLLADQREASVLDLGCGYGDFLRFLREQGYVGAYFGYDISPAMVAMASRLHGESADRVWRVGPRPEEIVDYAVASGVLNVKGDISTEVWQAYARDVIDVLAHSCRRGFAFNVLTNLADCTARRSDLYYADPIETLSFCVQRFGRSVALLHDYGLWEFTIIVRH